MTRADWYERVNATWPKDVPALSAAEAIRAGRKLYRFGMRRTFKGPVRVTSGNRYTWIRRGEMLVNPQHGWHGLVHLLSHYCHRRLKPEEMPHGRVHAQLEIRMIKEVLRRNWLDGKLRSQPKPPKPALDPLVRLLARRKAWATRSKRAANALRKIDKKIKRLQRAA
jgi:hypothetical protein